MNDDAETLYDIVSANACICPGTVAGWVWYCDAHDTHGNADSEPEAAAVAAAHDEWHGPEDECDLYVYPIRPRVS